MFEIVKGYLKRREVEYRETVSLASMCTVKIGNVASIVAFPDTIEKLIDLMSNWKNDY